MMFANFERSWFTGTDAVSTASSVTLFVLYMFIVLVMMLNILIAVVGDSYDWALIRARKLFIGARLRLVAELGAIERFFLFRFIGCFAFLLPRSWLRSQLAIEGSNEEDEIWLGRALDMERRTHNIVQASEARLLSRIDTLESLLRRSLVDRPLVKGGAADHPQISSDTPTIARAQSEGVIKYEG